MYLYFSSTLRAIVIVPPQGQRINCHLTLCWLLCHHSWPPFNKWNDEKLYCRCKVTWLCNTLFLVFTASAQLFMYCHASKCLTTRNHRCNLLLLVLCVVAHWCNTVLCKLVDNAWLCCPAPVLGSCCVVLPFPTKSNCKTSHFLVKISYTAPHLLHLTLQEAEFFQAWQRSTSSVSRVLTVRHIDMLSQCFW